MPRQSSTLQLALAPGFSVGLSASAQPCGTPWTLHPGPGPGPRSAAAIAYDSARGKVVLFGGRDTYSTVVGDTWEWTAAGPGGGGIWLLVSSTGPSARHAAAMVYDSVRQRCVLFGGSTTAPTDTNSNQTWEWNGSAWTQILPGKSPPAMQPLMAFDPVRARTVLVSTWTFGPSIAATWEYDGLTWARSSDVTPIADSFSAMAFDPTQSAMVLFGNFNPGGFWKRTAQGWTQVSSEWATEFPSNATFDTGLNKLVFAGRTSQSGVTALWMWDWPSSRWWMINTNGPLPTQKQAAVFDVAGNQTLTFGGMYPNFGPMTQLTHLVKSDVRSGPVLTDVGVRHLGLEHRGAPGLLSVAATGSGTVTYRWRRNGVELLDNAFYSGTATSTLTINPTDTNIMGSFDAVVTDSCGSTIRPATRLVIGCYANCDGSTGSPILSSGDFQCFMNSYAGGSNYANCDGSTTQPALTANDFMCFLNKWAECR